MLSCPLDSGRAEEGAPGLPVPLEARKNQCVCGCWISAAEEVPLGVDTTMTLMVHVQKNDTKVLDEEHGRGQLVIAIQLMEGTVN
jgi:hypothetical protein